MNNSDTKSLERWSSVVLTRNRQLLSILIYFKQDFQARCYRQPGTKTTCVKFCSGHIKKCCRTNMVILKDQLKSCQTAGDQMKDDASLRSCGESLLYFSPLTPSRNDFQLLCCRHFFSCDTCYVFPLFTFLIFKQTLLSM